jgi:glycosyltransferase involved in cell wall biosynthesis
MNEVTKKNNLIAGIDATNLRGGGGVTHLIELLSAATPTRYGFGKVIVWGPQETLVKIEPREWLAFESPIGINKSTLRRLAWQRYSLPKAAREKGCDVLFVPGGNFAGGFRPVVAMSQNMLPFEWNELKRYLPSIKVLRLLLLRLSQSKAFRDADGVIFLTNYAKVAVSKIAGPLKGLDTVIPHGINHRFVAKPRPQLPISAYTSLKPYKLIYVSVVEPYKHQRVLAKAVSVLRGKGYNLQLDLIGSAANEEASRLNKDLVFLDPDRKWLRYHGHVKYEELDIKYKEADLGVFASSCENLPIILLETMSAGLPIACSNRGPMPEVLQDAATYFEPEDQRSILDAIETLLLDVKLRERLAGLSFERAQNYSWTNCADKTFSFLSQIATRD